MTREHNQENEMAQEPLQKLRKIIQNESVLEVNPSLNGINPQLNSVIEQHKGNLSIYYGTGLCTPKELSVGLPFDTLGMMLLAEKLRRELGFKRIIHHIADTHAKTNSHLDSKKVDQVADQTLSLLRRINNNLGLSEITPILSSTFDSSKEYNNLLINIPNQQHDYIKREVADMEWYRQKYNMYIKIGWIIQSTETSLGSDERVFDRTYIHDVGEPLSFLYLKAGRTLDPKRPKASPYISIPGETRIMLQAGEDVDRKLREAQNAWNDPNIGGVKKHLMSVVRLYQELIEPLDRSLSVEQKIQTIIDTATK